MFEVSQRKWDWSAGNSFDMSITLVSGVNPNQLQASMALATNAQNAVENAIDRKEVSAHSGPKWILQRKWWPAEKGKQANRARKMCPLGGF